MFIFQTHLKFVLKHSSDLGFYINSLKSKISKINNQFAVIFQNLLNQDLILEVKIMINKNILFDLENITRQVIC